MKSVIKVLLLCLLYDAKARHLLIETEHSDVNIEASNQKMTAVREEIAEEAVEEAVEEGSEEAAEKAVKDAMEKAMDKGKIGKDYFVCFVCIG